MCLLWYNKFVKNTTINYSPKQGRFPVFISEPVLVFDLIMEEIEITKYLKTAAYRVGRKGYNSVNMLKTILFGFMDKGATKNEVLNFISSQPLLCIQYFKN